MSMIKVASLGYLRLETLLKLTHDTMAALLGLEVEALEQRFLGMHFSLHETEILVRLYRLQVIVDDTTGSRTSRA